MAAGWVLYAYSMFLGAVPVQHQIAVLNTEYECHVAAVLAAERRPENDYACSESWDKLMRSVAGDRRPIEPMPR